MKKYLTIYVLISSLIILTGCDQELKRSIGITKTAPNEYAVLKRPELHVPPKFDLVPPVEDSNSHLASDTKQYNSKTILQNNAEENKDEKIILTNADQSFIKHSDNYIKNANIKQVVAKESEEEKLVENKQSKSLIENIFGK